MTHLRIDSDSFDTTSDHAEYSCDDIRLAWLCAELAPGRTYRATPPHDFAALWIDR